MDSTQCLENGNTFISECAFGRIFKVTLQGEVAWEYVIPYFNEYPKNMNMLFQGNITVFS